jgi:hypothetical protein
VSPSTAKPKGIRRVERWAVGIAMAVVALVLERLVMRSVKGKGRDDELPTTTVTSKGSEVDID